ncbi:N-methyl-L-tryptophan oxidase [Occultella glacieicola]|uniref:N-methyl-L-tryptophan oxidase n=1 Tax=Occultella glacieicola TaxID=2518684 RepID=A0ABY2DY61_9MICO|nr:N-methyl-L-tryptophan oxidase [Occultella glacieicola]TDE88540.1 N-methyl-L-tryptophan oxidase [Occultella glacieicola]
MSNDAEVAVVGLGTVGSMALWRLAERGVPVHGYERFGIANTRGASGGQTRRFAAASQSEPFKTPLALAALELWRALEETTGQSLLTLTGGMILGPRDTPALVNAIRSMQDNALPHEVLDADELHARFPEHLIRAGDTALVDGSTGFLRPERSILSAVGAARARGAKVHDHTRVLAVEPDGDRVCVRTADGVRRYGRVVVAPGAWAPQLLGDLGPEITPRRLTQAWYLPRDVTRYRADVFGVFERVGDVRAYGFPSVDGATVKVGVWTRPHPVVEDLERLDQWVAQAWIDEIREVIATYLPGLHPDPTNLSTHIEGYSPDQLPVVGPSPISERVLIGAGFSGGGFKFAPVMGEILADYALTGATTRDLRFLRPDRFASAEPRA